MIEIGDTRSGSLPDPQQPSGGFAWWYVDLVTPAGDGAVLIAAHGLPFLPGYAAAARAGRPSSPASRPSLNLVAYRRGVPIVYLLQEYPPAQGRAEPDGWWLGRSRIVCTASGGRMRLRAELDCPVPGSRERLTGWLEMEGAARGPDPDAAPARRAQHRWTPWTGPAAGELRLRLGGREVAAVRGRAYHDRNHAARPLHRLGMERWIWARFPLAERERIVYLLQAADGAAPRCIGLDIDDDGTSHHLHGLRMIARGHRRLPMGPPLPREITLLQDGRVWATLHTGKLADAGPFYLRFLCDLTTAAGESARGWGEVCAPERVDLPLHRPFVRMRVHRTGRRNSLWLPLFSGPRRGRVGRLVRHALNGARA